MERVKSVKKDVRFVPRVIFEDWDAGDYQLMLSNSKNRVDCIRALRMLAKVSYFYSQSYCFVCAIVYSFIECLKSQSVHLFYCSY